MYSTFTGVIISLSLLNRIYISCIAPFFNTNPIIETSYGLIEGKTALSRSRRTFYSFTKIPYAKPPIGEYRFAVSTNIWYINYYYKLNFVLTFYKVTAWKENTITQFIYDNPIEYDFFLKFLLIIVTLIMSQDNLS